MTGIIYTHDRYLTFALITIFSFVALLPSVMYGVARYHSTVAVRLFDLINVYGYGMFIWIPVSVPCC